MSAVTPGTLYMVATPLGNLQDLSPRALATLQAVDLIAAEDTRRTRKLLSACGIQRPLESYHGDSGPQKAEKLLRQLRAGHNVAYVTDGGTPGISDPGHELVAAAINEAITVVPIPGPSAVTTALSVAGFSADRFSFLGFPPRQAEDYLRTWLARGETLVLFESPHRFNETLNLLAALAPDRALVIGREVTKQFEEWRRGRVVELAAALAGIEPRGEYVLVLGPVSIVTENPVLSPAVTAGLRQMLAAGLSVRDSAAIMATLGLLSRREAYQLALQLKEEEGALEAK